MNNRSLAKNAILNVIKQGCNIIFPFITFVYSSRVLGSEKIGMYSFGQSIVNYFVLIAGLGVTDYAVREASSFRNDKMKLKNFSCEVFTINLISSVFAYFGLFFLLIIWGKLEPYKYIIVVQSVHIILTTLGTDWINTVFEDFKYITIRYVLIQIVCIILVFVFVKDESDINIYTFLMMFAAAGGNIFNIFYVRKYVKIKPRIRKCMLSHLKPMLLLFFNNIAMIIYLNSDITILGMYESDSIIGVYSIVTKIYAMIKTMFNAVVTVSVPRVSYMRGAESKEKITDLCNKILNLLILLLIPICIVVLMESNEIIALIAGQEYCLGTDVLRIYSLSILLGVISCFNAYLILIPNKMEKWFALSTTVAAFVNITLNFILIPFFSINGAAITTFIAELLVMVITGITAKKYIKYLINRKDLATEIAGGIGIFIVCYCCRIIIGNYIIRLITAIIISSIVYIVVLILTHNFQLISFLRKFEDN